MVYPIKETDSTQADDPLSLILKSLSLEQQLKFAQETPQVKKVFEDLNKEKDYSQINVYKIHEKFIVNIVTDTNFEHFNKNGFQEFLAYFATKVETMSVFISHSVHEECRLEDAESIIPLIAEKMTNLKVLQINLCSCMLGKATCLNAVNVGNLLKMRNLKKLNSPCNKCTKMQFKHLCDLVYRNKIEDLACNVIIDPENDNDKIEYATLTEPVRLKKLRIKTTFDPRKWLNNDFPSFLKMFENLIDLALRTPDKLHDWMLAIIAIYCRNLEEFAISDTALVINEMLIVPPKLSKLFLIQCSGLTHTNLRQILTSTNITEFISIRTQYEGCFQDFTISPLIEKLEVDTVDMCTFQSAYKDNGNLKNLTWYHSATCQNKGRTITTLPLQTCINLEVLNVAFDGTFFGMNIIQQLKHLNTLCVTPPKTNNWSYIIDLLNHSPLRQLTMFFMDIPTEVPANAFRTNVTNLEIVILRNPVERSFDFWLDLYCQNADMKLTFFVTFTNLKTSLRTLINHPKFPRTLATLEYRTFVLDCHKLRSDFEETINKVPSINVCNNRPCSFIYPANNFCISLK